MSAHVQTHRLPSVRCLQASTSAENHNNSNSKLAAGALQSGALGSTGAMGPAGALAPNGTSNGSDKPAGTGFRLGDLSVGGDLGTFGLGSLNNLTAGSLDIAAMRQLTVMRSSNMEHLLGALTAGQDGSQLFSFNSLTQDVSSGVQSKFSVYCKRSNSC
jgi:hypothetical protein